MTMQSTRTPNFGDIYYAKLSGGEHIQHGVRPVVIAQNNIGNRYSPTVEVIPMSSNVRKARYMPTHVLIHPDKHNNLPKSSIVLAEQVVTVNKKYLIEFLGILDENAIRMIGEARRIQSPFL